MTAPNVTTNPSPKATEGKKDKTDFEKAIAELKHNARTLDDMYLEEDCRIVAKKVNDLLEENLALREENERLDSRCLDLDNYVITLEEEIANLKEST